MMSLLDPTPQEPLFPLIIEAIDAEGGDGKRTSDPSIFLGAVAKSSNRPGNGNDNDASNDTGSDATVTNNGIVTPTTQSKLFWKEAHALSCLRRISFHSSAEVTYEDAMSNVLLKDENDDHQRSSLLALHLDFVRTILEEECACIASDGAIVNNNEGAKEREGRYLAAFCMGGANVASDASSAGRTGHCMSGATEEQIETVARLAGRQLLASTPSRHHSIMPQNTSAPLSQNEAVAQEPPLNNSGGWFSYPLSFAQKITNGVNYAIDKALNAYEGDEYLADGGQHATISNSAAQIRIDDSSSLSVRKLLDQDVGLTRQISDKNEYDDAIVARRKGINADAMNVRGQQQMGNADDLISIEIVAYACRQLLSFVRQERHANSDLFFVCHQRRDVERIMLYKKGWDAHSFGSLCRQAGNHFENSQNPAAAASAYDTKRLIQLGKILSNISERGLDLLGSTLCQSNHALIEQDILTLFPGGIPSREQSGSDNKEGFAPSPSDRALFQIHATKHSIQARMARLEHNAATAKQNALDARKNGKRNNPPSSAMVHLRRHKAILAELERCAAVLANLDASELRLERAVSDVQIVQSYALLKEALQDIRTSNGDGIAGGGEHDIANVEKLMSGLREEMGNVTEEIGGGGDMYPEGVIEDEELNEEFKLLEMECCESELQQQADGGNNDAEAKEKQRLADDAEQRAYINPTTGQPTKEGSDTFRVKDAVAV